MPTIYREDGYRFFFYSNEGDNETREPPHVHVEKAGSAGKWWIDPVSCEWKTGFSPAQVRKIETIIAEHQDEFIKAWHDYFG